MGAPPGLGFRPFADCAMVDIALDHMLEMEPINHAAETHHLSVNALHKAESKCKFLL
jgi:hypothetical protein